MKDCFGSFCTMSCSASVNFLSVSGGVSSLGYLAFRYKQIRQEAIATTFGAAIKGSANIQPQMHHTNEDPKFAMARGPGIDLLSFVLITIGRLTSIEIAPTKLQNDATKPVMNRALSTGKVIEAQACKATNAAMELKYFERF